MYVPLHMSKTYLVIFCLLATSLAGCLSGDTGTDVIPYEPGSATLIQSEWTMTEHNVYFQQFTAPSTGEYTGMTIITVSTYGYSSCSEYSGVLGVAVYSHNATDYRAGAPSELIAQGTLSLDNVSANEYLSHTIQFDDSADLKSNTIYWVAIASESPIDSCRLELGYYGGYYIVETDRYGSTSKVDFIPPSNDYGLVKYMNSNSYDGNVTGFSASGGFPTSLDEYSVYSGEYAYWYRIF